MLPTTPSPATPGVPFERLLDWVEGRLSDEEAQAVAALVAQADASVQAEVARQRAFQQVRAQVVLETPPTEVREALMARFQAFAQGRQAPNLFQRLIAALTFDSAVQPNFAGARSATLDAPRQLVFSTTVADIVLNIQWRDQSPDGVARADLFGQMLAHEDDIVFAEFAVQLLRGTYRDGGEVAIVMADEIGEFAFTAIPEGSYQLVLSTATTNIILPNVELQRPTA